MRAMRCSQCGAENENTARFCSGCGAKARITMSEAEPRVLVVSCYRCGHTAPPRKYFARGANVAKLVVLLPVYFVLSLLFYFVRRDRLICGNCKKLLEETAPRAMLPATELAQGALISSHTSSALAPQQPATMALQDQAQQARKRGVGLGILSIPFSLGAFSMLGSSGFAAVALVATPGALLVGGAVAAFRRSRLLSQSALDMEEKYQRRRILELAGRRQGKLTVADVATSLGIDFKEAEHILDTLVDGHHVDVEVSDEGRFFYVFPDLIAARLSEK
jgi:hypothetical protein